MKFKGDDTVINDNDNPKVVQNVGVHGSSYNYVINSLVENVIAYHLHVPRQEVGVVKRPSRVETLCPNWSVQWIVEQEALTRVYCWAGQ